MERVFIDDLQAENMLPHYKHGSITDEVRQQLADARERWKAVSRVESLRNSLADSWQDVAARFPGGPLSQGEFEWFIAQPDGSVRDCEMYRRLCLHNNYTHNRHLAVKLDQQWSFLGLYPEVMIAYDITPEAIIK